MQPIHGRNRGKDMKKEHKKTITTKDFTPLALTINEILHLQEGVVEYYVETENTVFKANSLHKALLLWSTGTDKSEVISVGKYG